MWPAETVYSQTVSLPRTSLLSSFQARVNKVPWTLLILFLIIAKVGEVEFFVSPVFLDFDPGFEEDLIS